MNEKEVVRLYTKQLWTLRRIAEKFETNHHRVRRILHKHGVEISAKQRRAPMSDECKKQISERNKGRVAWSKGLVLSESHRRANMKGRSGTKIDLDRYENYERLLFLSQLFTKRRNQLGASDKIRFAFYEKFYFDKAFNAIYDAWVANEKSKWWYPSLDHKNSQFNGGDWELGNLQFLTWFENRAKAEMSDVEWQGFKEKTNTKSKLFIEEILNEF